MDTGQLLSRRVLVAYWEMLLYLGAERFILVIPLG